MTVDDVLAVLAEDHRHQVHYDPEADPDTVLGNQTTVAEWRVACDLLGTEALGRAMNARFGTSFSDQHWQRELEPAESKTLREVCELLASEARVRVIDPVVVFGRACRPAGAFLTVRKLLAEAGADVSRLRPSTPLSPYLLKYTAVFLLELTKTAPGRLPTVSIRTPAYWAFFGALLLSLFVMIVAGCAGAIVLAAWSALAAGASFAGVWFAASVLGPSEVAFGDLRTFRDLCYSISGEAGCGAHPIRTGGG